MKKMDDLITLHQPKQLEVGLGASAKLGAWAAWSKRPFVISSGPMVAYVERLKLANKAYIYDNVPPEPNLPALNEVLAIAKEYKPDLIIGLGGGSVMDVAKLVAALWDSPVDFHDVVGKDKITARRTPLAQVATTAGTGSEAGIRALITDPETYSKMAVESPYLLADIAILDPVLTYSVPPAVTAATGIDAMAHCVEAFTNINAHPLIDGFARMGFNLVGKYLARAVANGQDAEARAGMLLASYYGGICLGPVNTAAGHALAYPLGTHLSIPHGLANAIIFPHVLAFNTVKAPEKTAEVAQALGLNSQNNDFFDDAYRFCTDLGVEMQLSRYGAKITDLEGWAKEAHAIRRLMDNNPREMTVEDIITIYQKAY